MSTEPRSLAVLVCAALLLGGCVLQSRVPLYTEGAGELVLGAVSGPAVISSWRNGSWVNEGDSAEIAVKGQHYEATSESTVIDLAFVKLRDGWYVLQAVEREKPAVYMLAKIKDRTAEVTPLSCSDLKKDQSLAQQIAYEGDDCFIRPGLHMEGLFLKLLEHPDEATSRIAIAN